MEWKHLILSFLIVIAVALTGNLFTDTTIWYENVKPSITPPDYVFPVVWSILFMLIAIAIYFAFVKKNRFLINIFIINLLLNVLWSYLFFSLKKPVFAFWELIALWLSILIIIIFAWNKERKMRKISYLILPYLIWVSFAGILNYLIAF